MQTAHDRDARFMRSLLAASDDCIKVLTLDGKLSFMSEGGQITMEVSDFNAIKGCPWPDLWTGQGKEDVISALAEAKAGRSSRFQGYANTMQDNSRYWDVMISPIFGNDGQPEAILSVSRDITHLRNAEDRLRLLSEELQHRIKNTFSMVQAIATQTLKDGQPVEQLRKNFLARLHTLNDAQSLLGQTAWEPAAILDIVKGALAPFASPSRLEISGPELYLSSKCALGLALGLHELGTNASKYGALHNHDGLISLEWSTANDVFRLIWEERGGPPVQNPTRIGFGSRIIERALASYFNGKTEIIYHPTGVVFTLEAPVAALTAN